MNLSPNKHFGTKKQRIEDHMVVERIKQMEKELKEGKRKTLTEEDVLKKYPHLKDYDKRRRGLR